MNMKDAGSFRLNRWFVALALAFVRGSKCGSECPTCNTWNGDKPHS